MSKNDEICFKVTIDVNNISVVEQYIDILSQYQDKASDFSDDELEAYIKLYRVNQKKVNSLSGNFGDSKKRKLELNSLIITRDWQSHVSLVKDDPHGIDHRIELLEFIREGFKNHNNFSDMSEGLRRTIAGLPTDHHEHWAWFGSMKGAGRFHNRIKVNNPYISSALDKIPLNGEVTEKDYFEFIKQFQCAFPDGGDGVALASRLLAMKRADIFVCIDGKNKRNLCLDFGIAQNAINYDSYWFEVIGRIQASVWWQTEKPDDAKELEIFNGRAALLDCIFYETD
jgi:hypothetical protein